MQQILMQYNKIKVANYNDFAQKSNKSDKVFIPTSPDVQNLI